MVGERVIRLDVDDTFRVKMSQAGSQYVARTCNATDFDCHNVISGHITARHSE